MSKWAAAAILTGHAWAQCSMCQTAAASQGSAGAKTMNTAILILLLPALVMFSGVFAALRSGSKDDRSE